MEATLALYLITYDLRAPGRNYGTLHKQLTDWKAARICESVWLADLTGPASTVRDILQSLIDNNDRLFVIQQFSNAQWAAHLGMSEGVDWLRKHIP